MTPNTPMRERPPRINPFAFPSDTDLRFALLVVAVVGVSLYLYDAMYFHFHQTGYAQIAGQCAAALRSLAAGPDVGQALAQSDAPIHCLDPLSRGIGLWLLGGIGVVLALTFALYWLAPAWKRRREGLEPFTAADDPDLIASIGELCREAGLSRPPTILTNADMSPSGLAFGRWGRYDLVLNAGLIMQHAVDPAFFRAVVRHELAHLESGDVDKVYLSLSAGASFLVAALLPYAILTLTSPHGFANLLAESWRVVVALTLIFGPLAGILRAREHYADVRASGREGPDGALGRVLEASRARRSRRPQVRVHPDPEERRRVIEDPRRLLTLGFRDALLTGLVATIAYPELALLLGDLTAGAGLAIAPNVLAGVIFGSLAAGVVGTGVWRGVFAGLTDPRHRLNLDRLAGGLGIGFAVGPILSSAGGLVVSDPLAPPVLAFSVGWGILVVLVVRLLLSWVASGARAWLASRPDRSAVRWGYRIGLLLAALISGLSLGVLLLVRDFSVGFLTNGSDGLVTLVGLIPFALAGGALIVLPHPLTIGALLGVWAFPLLAAVRRRPARPADARWLWLDAPEPAPTLIRPSPPTPRLALRAGLASGLLFAASLVVVHLGLRLGMDGRTFSSDAFYTAILFGQIGAGLAWQLGLAAWVARRASSFPVIHALGALTIAGPPMLLGIIGTSLVLGPGINPAASAYILGALVNLAALLALPLAWRTARRASATPPADLRPTPAAT